ncbi:hypothetical protein B0H13DRAFT_1926748 [Mycena leptocephala]|nr:hypothetical protein B0H13DRAFT_1926748 [Mycena leptocephala]
MAGDDLDGQAWAGQLELLDTSTNACDVRRVLYTMSAERLFYTALISRKMSKTVSDFLDFLRRNEPEEDQFSTSDDVSDSGSTNSSDGGGDSGSDISVDLQEDVDMALVAAPGFNDLPLDLGIDVVTQLGYTDRVRLAGTSTASAMLVSEVLQHDAARILKPYNLDFGLIRLMQTATGTGIGGSTVTALIHGGRAFEPGDLDFVTGPGLGASVVDFLILTAGYEISGESIRKINVIESWTNNPLDAITNFHLTCVYGAWLANGFWHGYASLTTSGIAIATPSTLSTAQQRDLPKVQAVVNNDDVSPTQLTCWSMGGTGCENGILTRGGVTAASSSAKSSSRWLRVMRTFVARKIASWAAST